MVRTQLVLLLAILTCLSLTTSATAEIFSWTDSNGNVGFADRIGAVPAEYREQLSIRSSSSVDRQVQFYHQADSLTHTSESSNPRAAGQDIISLNRDGNLLKVMVRINDEIEAPFYIDTAASGITLTSQVAQRIADTAPAGQRTTKLVHTANGQLRLDEMSLQSVQVGESRVSELKGLVNPHLETGLLGADFFNHFTYSIDPRKGTLTLDRYIP